MRLHLAATLCATLLGAWLPTIAAGDPAFTVYPAPGGIAASTIFSVSIGPSGSAQGSFVYLVDNIGLAQYNWQGHAWNNSEELTTSWTSFDFGGSAADFDALRPPVTIQVQMSIPSPAYQTPAVRILPSAAGIAAGPVVVAGQTYQATFQIERAGQYSVEFYDAAANPDFSTWVPQNPLLIFANPPEREAPNPKARHVRVLHPGDPIPVSGDWGTQDGVAVDTLYFMPGVYDLGLVASPVNPGIYVLHSNQTIYLAGGAYVKGAFVTCPNPLQCTDAADIRIFGRGVLSGENFQRSFNGATFESLAADLPALIQLQGTDIASAQFDGERGALIEGLTFIQAPFDNVYLGGIDNTVDNVKLVSWYPSTDGIKAGYDYYVDGVEHPGHGRVSNSFLKDGDDSIHLYSTGLRVDRAVIWQSKNASPFEFGSGNPGSIDDVQVAHSTVIHTEWNWPNMANALFVANLGGTGNKGYRRGYTFEDIEVEELRLAAVSPVDRAQHLAVRQYRPGHALQSHLPQYPCEGSAGAAQHHSRLRPCACDPKRRPGPCRRGGRDAPAAGDHLRREPLHEFERRHRQRAVVGEHPRRGRPERRDLAHGTGHAHGLPDQLREHSR